MNQNLQRSNTHDEDGDFLYVVVGIATFTIFSHTPAFLLAIHIITFIHRSLVMLLRMHPSS